jgi:PKD repeat protein
VLSEIDREAFNGGYDYHSVQRRSVSSGPTPTPTQPPVIGHFARLTGDRHNLAIVHWSGENSTAIFILTVVRYRNGSSRQSNLWRSINYGFNFTMDNNKVNNTVLDYYYINPHNKTKLIFTAEIAQRLYITENEGDSYSCVKVPFVPNDVDYSPFLEESVTAYDQTHKALFVSADHGKTWTSVGKNITKYYWEVLESEDYTKIYFEQLHGSGSKVYVISAPYHSANIKEFQPSSNRYHFDQSSLVLSHEYILSQVTANGSATLYVSHNRGPFVAAQFPLHNQLHEKDYLLVDASEGQVFVAVNHRSNLTSLYMSEALGISYTLVLEDVVTTSDASWASNSATVQLYHVLGVQGTYFVNQHRHDRTPWTLVSFDKGAQWLTVPAPAVDNHGRGTYCYQPNCSLQLDVRSMFSRDSSIGLIWAQGNVGQSKTTRNEGSFMSRDGGLTWQWVFDAYFLASFADHGAVIAAAQRTYTYRQRTTNQIQHSCDEGTTWKSITMPLSIHVIGVLTEPGERSLIISVFGFENGWTEWLMGQLDFRQIASDPCKPTDYYNWIPTDERIGRRCLLGQSVVYRRRKADVCCFNGYDFEVPISTSICECAKEDFECDFGYERAELGSPCMPSPGTPSKGPPLICPEGQSYNVTRGYRKVAGDVCHIGNEAMSFIQEVLPCPIDPPGGLTIKCDHSIVSPGEKLTFVLKQSSGGIITTSYTWSFDDGTQDQTFIGYSNSQTVVHAFSRSRDSPYLISVVAQNAGGQISAIKPIVVYDKIVNAEVVYLKPVVKNILATFSVHLDTSQNQSYGSVQYLWYPSKGSFSIVTNLPVFSHIYKEAGLYEAKVDISNYLPNVAPLTVHYQVTVNSGPGGLLLTASPSRIAAGQRVSFTLNQTVGTTKNSTVYTWNFGDGHTINVTSFSHSHHVVHQYLNSSRTLYKIKVTAITGFADASASTYIVVNGKTNVSNMLLLNYT